MKESAQEALRKGMEELLSQNPEHLHQWVERLASLYECALLEEFLANRRTAYERIEANLKAAIAQHPAASVPVEVPPVPTPKVDEVPVPVPDSPQFAMAEVKVLPPPEGPPKPAPKAPPAPVEHAEAQLDAKVGSAVSAAKKGAFGLGLNDRISLARELFGNQQEDLNRVLSQISTFATFEEAENFLVELVKPDYDWSGKGEYEERFMDLIKAHFGVNH